MLPLNILNLVVLALLTVTNAAPSAVATGPAAVNLRTAANYAILAQAGVSTVPPSAITGSIGVSPIAADALSGFSLALSPNGQFSTSSQVVGELFAASYAAPTPSTLTVAIGDVGTAFTDAAGRLNPNFTNLANGTIGGLVFAPGLYKWAGAVNANTSFTISGTPLDTWIFQIAGIFNLATGAKVTLAGGALSSNIVWVVSSTVTAAAGAHLEGVILGETSVNFLTGATLNGRIFAGTAVMLQKATVVS